MTDPVAEAAEKIAADAAPSSTEPSLLEKAINTIHDLEAKVEHLIHPETEAPKVEAPGEIVAAHAEAAPVDTSATTSASAAASVETPAVGEAGNVLAAATASSLPQSSTPAVQTLPETSMQTLTVSSENVETPNAAPAAVEQLGSQTSVAPVSTPDGIPGIVVSSPTEPVKLAPPATSAIRAGIANIKHHLSIRGFEQSAVADIHAELEAIEKWL